MFFPISFSWEEKMKIRDFNPAGYPSHVEPVPRWDYRETPLEVWKRSLERARSPEWRPTPRLHSGAIGYRREEWSL